MAAAQQAKAARVVLKQEADAEIKMEEPDPAGLAEEERESAAPPRAKRSRGEAGPKVKEEPVEEEAVAPPPPEEGPSGSWDARLQEFLKTLQAPGAEGESPPLPALRPPWDGPKASQQAAAAADAAHKWPQGLWVPPIQPPIQPHLIGEDGQGREIHLESVPGAKGQEGIFDGGAASVEKQRQRFRSLRYQEAGRPWELCRQLRDLCRQWLRPERHTKEQMLELVTLEQFLALLPPDMQSWVRANRPETCAQAVTLAEGFLLQQREAKGWDPQSTTVRAYTVTPKQKKVEKKGGKKKEMITVEVKKEMIKKYERGMRVAEIARFYKKSTSTICTILRKKQEIRELDAAKGVTRISKQRPGVLEDVEKLLLVWINEKQLAGDTLTENIICEKAKALYTDLVSKRPVTSTENKEVFKASRGWFDNFKRRSGIHGVVRRGDAASSDAKAAEALAAEFQKLVASECYLPEQVFNCDETGLFWKKMPKRTYLTEEENAMPGPRPMEDRLTLLFCANASGDFKVKPLLVYHSENPQAFRRCQVQKSQLNVMWRSNSKAWVTRILFIEWINEVFGPAVKKYLLEKNLPLKALLVMDNAPAHPPDLEDDLLEEFEFIKVKFLPSNITPILQPMDQQVISNFKKLYTKALFQQCFEVTEGTNLTLREFWNNHFHITNCLKIIDQAWNGVTKRTLNSAWRKLWPDCVAGHDMEGLADKQEPPVVDEIVSLGKAMGLEVDEDDIQELVEDRGQELTTNELMDLHREQQQEVTEEGSSAEEEQQQQKKAEGSLTSSEISETCKMWETVQSFVEKHHLNKTVAVRAMNLFNDNAMSHFCEILKRRQKRVSLERFLVEVARKEKDSTEPVDSGDSVSDSKSHPTQ